jgi:hypothetical protein
VQISAGKNNVNFKPVTVKNVDQFLEIALSKNWSPSVFKDDYRNKENFERAECIALDIDNDEPIKMTLDEAKKVFKDYKHLIMPSKSHRKEKNGEVKDRFRVLLFLTRPIDNEQEYYSTWHELQRLWPAIDPSCKDPSRFYYPSTECVSKNLNGTKIEPVVPVEDFTEETQPEIDLTEVLEQGELSRKTYKFMMEGARPGNRHRELYKAARDYHQNNYSQEKFIADMEDMIKRTGNWAQSGLSAKDVATVDDAFRVDPKHDVRGGWERAFLFQPIGEIFKTETKLEWLIHRLLTVGGLSLIAGPPKAGKSTLIRQLQKSVCRGEDFLGRTVKKGKVFCLALEEQEEMLKEQYAALGITDKDDLEIHVGPPMSGDTIQTLGADLERNKVALLVVDTLMLASNIQELNSYSDVNNALMPFRNLARETGTHIVLIHHSNKHGVGGGAILGSNAIAGAVDQYLVFEAMGKKRMITTKGRGVHSWSSRELLFDAKTETYTLGAEPGFEEDGEF